MDPSPGHAASSGTILHDPAHRAALIADAHRALDLFAASKRDGGGFHELDRTGRPIPRAPQQLHVTTRLVHSYALARMAGRPDDEDIVGHGMDALWNRHRDRVHGGYHWALHDDAPVAGPKLAYGHVFVLLAASSARMVGHPDADRLLDDVAAVLQRHFWDEDAGLLADEFTTDWQPFSTYRGMNANMHGAEAMLAAYEATGRSFWLDRAGRILNFFIAGQAARHDWRIPEHYHGDWRPDPAYAGDPMFRPPGTTPGHSFEMARLLLQWWDLSGRPSGDAPAQARALVDRALSDAWDPAQGGLAYTMAGDRVGDPARYWWPVAEAIGALAALITLDPDPVVQTWYRRLWAFADAHLIDHDHGGWHPCADRSGGGSSVAFDGKPDLYHALQADLLPLSGRLSRQGRDLFESKPLARDGTAG